jgi:hypothetical protein
MVEELDFIFPAGTGLTYCFFILPPPPPTLHPSLTIRLAFLSSPDTLFFYLSATTHLHCTLL